MAEPTYAELAGLVSPTELIASQAAQIKKLTATFADLDRRLVADASNSSRPPSSDPP